MKTLLVGLRRSISRARVTYDEPLQHTAKLRAAERGEKAGGSEQRGLSAWMPT